MHSGARYAGDRAFSRHQAVAIAGVAPWPPSVPVLDVMASLCRKSSTLSSYLVGVRSAVTLLGGDVGAFRDTKSAVAGLDKSEHGPWKFRPVATPRNVLHIVRWLHNAGRRGDLADAFRVTWQYCLRRASARRVLVCGRVPPLLSCGRFGSEAVALGHPDHSLLTVQKGATKKVCVQLRRRKNSASPDPAGCNPARDMTPRALHWQIWRECVCDLVGHGPDLCGVCAILRRGVGKSGRLWPNVTYNDGLAYVKLAARVAGLETPFQWGTHVFRKGRADLVRDRARISELVAHPPGCVGATAGWTYSLVPSRRLGIDGCLRVRVTIRGGQPFPLSHRCELKYPMAKTRAQHVAAEEAIAESDSDQAFHACTGQPAARDTSYPRRICL